MKMQMKMRIIILMSFVVSGCFCGFGDWGWGVVMEGTWREALVIGPIGPCEPCQYTISFNENYAKFVISNPQTNQSQTYNLQNTPQKLQPIFLTRTTTYTGYLSPTPSPLPPQPQITLTLTITPQTSTIYSYLIQIPQISLYIEDSWQSSWVSVVVRCGLVGLFVGVGLPLRRKQLEKEMLETYRRICMFSLFMYAQVIVVVTAVLAVVAIQFVYYSPTIFTKLLSYSTLGPIFLLTLIQSTSTISILQTSLNTLLPNQTRPKFALLFLTIFIGLIGYPLLLTTFHKGAWFFYMNSIGIVVQFIVSYYGKMLPYWKFVWMYVGVVFGLAVLVDGYPVLGFWEIGGIGLVGFGGFVGVVVVGGVWVLRRTGRLEEIAAMFDVGLKRTTDSTQVQESQAPQNNEHIKSDFELEDKLPN